MFARNFRNVCALAATAVGGVALAQIDIGATGTPKASRSPASVSAGLLSIVTSNAQQQIEITVGPVAGEVSVSGVSGIDSNSVFTGITDITLLTGTRFDYVEFRIQSDVVPNITVGTGRGDSDVKFIYELPTSLQVVSSSVTVNGGTGNDKADFYVLNAGPGFTAQWTVNHGAGNNESTASVNALSASDLIDIAYTGVTGAGQDKLEFQVTADATTLNLAVNGQLGGNDDTANLNVLGLNPLAAASFNLGLDLGAGNDASNFEYVNIGSSVSLNGRIAGGDGFDTAVAKLESDGSVSLEMDGGAGNDLLDMSFKGTLDGAPRLLGGSGDDELKIVVDGPILMTPFLDGGPGIDKATGFGTIINCEIF